jgi:hypothetical protein
MSKKKVTVKVAPGQAVLVADVAIFEHIALVYYDMASQSEDPDSWRNVADTVMEWMNKTYVPETSDYEDDQW